MDRKTGEITYKRVLDTFRSETDTVVHVRVNGEELITTEQHPFYVEGKGWVEASALHAGMVVWLADGTKVIIEDVWVEYLAEAIAVYNFKVDDFHTYFVGYSGVLVHNAKCQPTESVSGFIEGKNDFDEALDDYSQMYADSVNANQPWSWAEDIPGGENLTAAQKRKIRKNAADKELLPSVTVTKTEGMRYGFADFESAGLVKESVNLPEDMWKKTDAEQFDWLNKQIGGKVEGYTWHHSETPGVMQLVPMGVHNVTTHNGGRTAGMWAAAPRKGGS